MSGPRALDASALADHPLPPIEAGDKDRHGAILIVAGARDIAGAPLLTAHGAMRAGAGKLQIAVPDTIAVPLGVAMPEAMVRGYAGHRDGGFGRSAVAPIAELACRADAIVAGPAVEENPAARKLASALLDAGRPLVLDAALLQRLADRDRTARDADAPLILLPHAGEMASLIDCAPADVEADPIGCGRRCADRYRALVLVKGTVSHIVAPDGAAWRFTGGVPGLGVSGSGDVLAGAVGGLLARGAAPLSALLWGVWLHGMAGQALSRLVGPTGFLARELPAQFPALLAQASRP